MNKLSQHIAFTITFMAGLRLLVKAWLQTGLIEDKVFAREWVEILMTVILTPLPLSDFLLFAVSLSALGMLSVLKRTTRHSIKSHPLSQMPREECVRDTPCPASLPLTQGDQTISKERVDEEWHDLEDADKEAIREMVVQDGLWESDITALLQVRGLRAQLARGESLADRVSFVQCDYAGYYSIAPEYRAVLEAILATEYAEETP